MAVSPTPLRRVLPALFGFVLASLASGAAWAGDAHAIAMQGEPLYKSRFGYFDYVNPEAPKGGRIVLGEVGSFDSLNPFVVKGTVAAGIRQYAYESLMTRGWDEPFTLYGLVAETIDAPPDRSSVTFTINPAAKFSDGSSITADDVLFSFELLREKGRPNHRTYYAKVTKAEKVDERMVRFRFPDGSDRELPLIMGLMPILSKAHTDPATFENTTLEPPVASGPYMVAEVDPGRSITYRRNPDYWGWDVPSVRGRFNFDEIRIDYFRDTDAMFEAFKAGEIDMWRETDPARWQDGFDFPAVAEGRVVKVDVEHGRPSGMNAFVFNTRRAIFADQRVRQALELLFDFEWVNARLYGGGYVRTRSLFDNTDLAGLGPMTEAEENYLNPYLNQLSPGARTTGYRPPVYTDERVDYRRYLRQALDLLAAAGWQPIDGVLRQSNGAPFTFEILLSDPRGERLAVAFADRLRRLGMDIRLRTVESAQYQKRLSDYDFDMIIYRWGVTLSPGNEQLFYWSSTVADQPGSRNYPGIKNEAVDAMIQRLLAARSSAAFVPAVRALDRVLMDGTYFIPLFHSTADWIAHSKRVVMPQKQSLYGAQVETWWASP